MAVVIKNENLAPWLRKLASAKRLVAPTLVKDNLVFCQVDSPAQIVFDYTNAIMSPKEWFFPQTEPILQVQKDGKQVVEVKPVVDDTDQVIFGVRPCDARGLAVLDKVFLSNPVDSNYQSRREHTTLIGLACRTAVPGCFCTSMGTGPGDSTNVDILLANCEAGYIVEAVTEKGQATLAEAQTEEMEVQTPPIAEMPIIYTENLQTTLWNIFDDEMWTRLADRCLGCRVCTYLCPTCHCFNVRDYENMNGSIDRLRGWDSCQAVGFYRLAGGHNPRPTKAARLRQRFYHKLLYIPERSGILGCVGCGRCVQNCPVNIDVREVITNIVDVQEKVGVKSV